jgi:hypothetical protein
MIRTMPLLSALLLVPSAAHAAAPDASSSRESSLSAAAITASPTPERDMAPATLGGRHGMISHNGFYLAPSLGTTSINGNLAYNVGFRGAWLVNRTFGLGLAGYGFGWDGRRGDNPTLSSDRRLNGGYGGLLMQYVIGSKHVVHGLIDTTVGGGYVCTDETDDGRDCNRGRSFFMVEPTASVEVNVTDFMRISLGGGYRLAAAEERQGVSGRDLSGFVARTNLEFGIF